MGSAHRRGENTFNTPLNTCPPIEGICGNMCNFSPFSDAVRHAVPGQQLVGVHIAMLLQRRGPSTILFRIRAILIWKAVKRMVCAGTRTHIGQEGLKRGAPCVTHRDATGAIVSVCRALRIRAAIAHLIPNPVFGRLRLPMRRYTWMPTLMLQASTALGLPTFQQRRMDQRPCATDTETIPSCMLELVIRATFLHNQATKRLSCQINKGWHSAQLPWLRKIPEEEKSRSLSGNRLFDRERPCYSGGTSIA
jgi:hypothetical protein